MISEHVIPLSELALDYPEPAGGWAVELGRRHIPLTEDDLGRPSIPRTCAAELLTEQRQLQGIAARHRQEAEQRAVEADERFRARLPKGIPAGQVPDGVTPGQLLMLSDPMAQGARRQSVLEHALARRGDPDALAGGGGEIVYHPIAGGES